MNIPGIQKFPRKLTDDELELLFTVLPRNRKGYADYRQKIIESFVIGYGRFGGSNLILGAKDDKPDLTISSAPILAFGTLISQNGKANVLIHEYLDGLIEIDISLSGDFKINEAAKKWNYSEWIPGKTAPGDNSFVREIHLIKNKLVLAIAPVHKRIWVYDADSEINFIIPVTNYYNEVFRIAINKDKKSLPNIAEFFNNLDNFSDEILGQGFLSYNKYLNKINLDYKIFQKSEKKDDKKKSFFSFFTKRR